MIGGGEIKLKLFYSDYVGTIVSLILDSAIGWETQYIVLDSNTGEFRYVGNEPSLPEIEITNGKELAEKYPDLMESMKDKKVYEVAIEAIKLLYDEENMNNEIGHIKDAVSKYGYKPEIFVYIGGGEK